MKDGLKYIVGKRIAAVVVAKSKRPPHIQVFFVFPDGSRFEFWGDSFSCCAGLDDARRIERYVKSGGGEIVAVYRQELTETGARYPTWPMTAADLPKSPRPPRPSPRELVAMGRAWSAIAKAKRHSRG